MVKIKTITELKDCLDSKVEKSVFQINDFIITIIYQNKSYTWIITDKNNRELWRVRDGRKKLLIKNVSKLYQKVKGTKKESSKKEEKFKNWLCSSNFDLDIKVKEEFSIDNCNTVNQEKKFELKDVVITVKEIKEKWIERDLNRLIANFSENWFIYESEIPAKLKNRKEVKKILDLTIKEDESYVIIDTFEYLKDKEKYWNEFVNKIHWLWWIYKKII